MLKAVIVAALLAAGTGTEAQTLPPVLPIGKYFFWFNGQAAFKQFLDGLSTPAKGVTALQPGSNVATTRAAVALAHSKGVAVIGGIGGNCNDPKVVATCEVALANMAAAGVDGVYVDEPGGAPVSVDPSQNSMSPASINYVVSTFNPLIDYFRARRPGAHFGFTMGDGGSVAMHEALIAAGLKADFASMEEYGGAQIDVWAGFKAQYPNVNTMILAYNTLALCRGDHGLANVSTDDGGDVDIWGFWDLDNFGGWIGPNLDADWLKNASHFAATNDRSFCFLPTSEVNPNNWTWATQTTDFTIGAYDMVVWTNVLPGDPTYQIASCQYRVISGANVLAKGPSYEIVTRDWTDRPCGGNFTVTVGPGKDCRDPGRLTCLVYTRNTLVTPQPICGCQFGHTSYSEWSVSF